MVKSAVIVSVGKCILELRAEGDHWRLAHGGDTFNTAIYRARLDEDVAYFTALGDDPFSAAMRVDWQSERLRLDLVLTAPRRLPGLYAVQTDAVGERNFHYWCEQAAVRYMFRLPAHAKALDHAAGAQLLYLSGITLALFDEPGWDALAVLAQRVRNSGGDVAFDPNYRPAIWPSSMAARDAIAVFASLATIAPPTFDDEAKLHGDAAPAATAAGWRTAGAREVVAKLGAAGCLLDGGQIVAPTGTSPPVDTTGAGDAFNAGYLATRRRGLSGIDAAAFGNRLATASSAAMARSCRGTKCTTWQYSRRGALDDR